MSNPPAKIIYFPMEIAARELDSRLLLAIVAAKRGFEVVLGQKWLIERNIEYMTPGVYLSKTMTLRDARALQRAKDAGYITAAIDEEIPGLLVHDRRFWWVSRAALDATDIAFLPGSHNSENMAAAFGLDAGRVRQAANPRWDLLRSELRPAFQVEAAELRRRYGDFILVNSNLGFTNSEKGTAQQMIRVLIEQGKVDANDAPLLRHFGNIVAMEEMNRAALIALLPALAKRFPSLRIILRPHPSERVESWSEWIADTSNLTIVREGSAIPWILASKVLVHTNCTTGVEAIALDKPAICVVPVENPINHWYLSAALNPVVKTEAEALATIERVLADPDSCYSDSMKAAFRDCMSFDPVRLGAETMLDAIVALGDARGWARPSPTTSDWRTVKGYRWRMRDKNVRGVLFPKNSLDNVRTRLEQYCRLLHQHFRPRIESCGSKVILLSDRHLSFSTRLRRAIRI